MVIYALKDPNTKEIRYIGKQHKILKKDSTLIADPLLKPIKDIFIIGL